MPPRTAKIDMAALRREYRLAFNFAFLTEANNRKFGNIAPGQKADGQGLGKQVEELVPVMSMWAISK